MRISHSRYSVQALQVPAKYMEDSLLISVSNVRNPFLYFLMKHTVLEITNILLKLCALSTTVRVKQWNPSNPLGLKHQY